MTLSKIAKLAHVSVSTVSKAFSESGEINEKTREEIFKIAKELGCFKKYYNAKYPKFVIAIICPEFKSSYYSAGLSFIQEYLSDKNCEICVAETDFSEEKEQELLKYYNLYTSVDGIIIINGHTDTSDYEIPIVNIGSAAQGAFNISNDYTQPIAEAIEYFKSKNVTDIGFISEEKTTGKLDTFKDCMSNHSLNVNNDYVSITVSRFEEGGYKAMEELFKRKKIPRAIICAYDNMAVGAIRCIYDKGLKVPDDIAILGMDNNRECAFLNPPLSSIDEQLNITCKLACDTVINILNNKPVQKSFAVKGKLILRESTVIT